MGKKGRESEPTRSIDPWRDIAGSVTDAQVAALPPISVRMHNIDIPNFDKPASGKGTNGILFQNDVNRAIHTEEPQINPPDALKK